MLKLLKNLSALWAEAADLEETREGTLAQKRQKRSEDAHSMCMV